MTPVPSSRLADARENDQLILSGSADAKSVYQLIATLLVLLTLFVEPSLEGRGWENPFNDTKMSRYEESVNTFYQIRYCLPKEPCKRQFRMEFLCRCTNNMNCGSPGLYYNAYCQVEVMGVIWVQPKIIEYRGHIIVLSGSSSPVVLQDKYNKHLPQSRTKKKRKREK